MPKHVVVAVIDVSDGAEWKNNVTKVIRDRMDSFACKVERLRVADFDACVGDEGAAYGFTLESTREGYGNLDAYVGGDGSVILLAEDGITNMAVPLDPEIAEDLALGVVALAHIARKENTDGPNG